MSLKSKVKKAKKKVKKSYGSVKKYVPTKTVKNVADVVTGGRVSAVMRTVSDVSADYGKLKNIFDDVKDVRSGSSDVKTSVSYLGSGTSDVKTSVSYSGVSKDVKRKGLLDGLVDWLLSIF